ncbi:hypothetical protein [Enteractinococcus helveticum]|uniref:hypothetical protein n=1 Tax=Enteractinococcus helveticum TaxID=1837282 RepID=UPI000A62F72C|nr:hypothetical protein [Enteractinococcus helveticum]
MGGYDLGQAFAGSVNHFWHADQSQIYHPLERQRVKLPFWARLFLWVTTVTTPPSGC